MHNKIICAGHNWIGKKKISYFRQNSHDYAHNNYFFLKMLYYNNFIGNTIVLQLELFHPLFIINILCFTLNCKLTKKKPQMFCNETTHFDFIKYILFVYFIARHIKNYSLVIVNLLQYFQCSSRRLCKCGCCPYHMVDMSPLSSTMNVWYILT